MYNLISQNTLIELFLLLSCAYWQPAGLCIYRPVFGSAYVCLHDLPGFLLFIPHCFLFSWNAEVRATEQRRFFSVRIFYLQPHFSHIRWLQYLYIHTGRSPWGIWLFGYFWGTNVHIILGKRVGLTIRVPWAHLHRCNGIGNQWRLCISLPRVLSAYIIYLILIPRRAH